MTQMVVTLFDKTKKLDRTFYEVFYEVYSIQIKDNEIIVVLESGDEYSFSMEKYNIMIDTQDRAQ